MEQAKLILAIALSFLVFFLWETFFVKKEAVKAPQSAQHIAEVQKSAPSVQKPAETVAPTPIIPAVPPAQPSRLIVVDTPLYRVSISENGAVFKSFTLKKYKQTVAKDSPAQELIPETVTGGSLQTRFSANTVPGLDTARFVAGIKTDQMAITNGPKSIRFTYASPKGVIVEKRFSFSPDSYLIDMAVTVVNSSHQDINDGLSIDLVRPAPEETSRYGFEGPSALIGNSLKQISLKDIAKKGTYEGSIEWTALESRYFMTSLIPKDQDKGVMRLSETDDHLLRSEYVCTSKSLAPGAQQQFTFQLYFGPKSLKILSKLNIGLERAINFGWFDILAKPCLWLMNFLYGFIPNYGVAIIILTIISKIILWPLGNKSYKSMNDMKKLAPLMAEIREKYKNDKQKMNQETMALYKTYKVNPMGGCLPMVVQIPVFFALYRMLYEAIELRHAPFFGWINDLSAPDRLFHFNFSIPMMTPPYGIPVLTIIMGATMFLQQKMSPAPGGDPTQAKLMMFMPLLFTVIFINFSSGLVLYWLVNNILSIAQQYYVQKQNA
jgi:YidC/Oxa1 family membrane protein insertase